jgi:aminopeptidase
MLDPRTTKLAHVLVNYSTALKAGEKVLIEAIDVPPELPIECARMARAAGGHPLIMLKNNQVNHALMIHGTQESWNLLADVELLQMQSVQCYIGVRGSPNISELSDLTGEQLRKYESSVWKRVHIETRVPKTRWVVLRWPNPSMAQLAQMSTEAFENFYFDVCTLEYGRMNKAMQPLKARLEAADQVRLLGPQDTDLRFSVKGLPAITCSGSHNIPDGEVFTAPVRDSVNGVIHYNTPTLYRGVTHENIRFVFRAGKIVEASSTSTDKLNEVLDTDEGARYVGEFAFGVNPYVTRAMKDTLFDEKIAGSIHFTPGGSYDEADNGNKSEVHWDIVLIQTPEYGGGEIYLDGQLIRKDGLFIPNDLKPLNPENLK